MIELNSKTQQDFLNREWVQKLLDAGVDMSDAKYCIVEKDNSYRYFIALKNLETASTPHYYFLCPTYTVSELLYKLPNYIEDRYGFDYKFKLEIVENSLEQRGYRAGYYKDIECLWMSLDHQNLIKSIVEAYIWATTTPKEKRFAI